MYRAEHPNPQFERDNYECLNGPWDFCYGKVGGKENCALDLKIEVPFCPESEMSGIHNTDFITDCVYSREIDVKQSDLDGRLVLHFGAVDYKAEVYVNGVKAGEHEGGYTAFEIEITAFVKVGKNRITVAVHDDINENVPSGKQSRKSQSFGCFYTRATGIWQTVWLERTPKAYIKQVKFYPNIADVTVKVELITEGNAPTEINVYCGGKQVGKATGDGYYRHEYVIQLTEKHLWSIGCGEIYDVFIKFGEDEVKSYFGLRSVEYKNGQFLLNGKSVFQRLVLDQGYYPTSVYTATSVEDIRFDILSAWKLGFNGLRLHQKVFDQRYLYECDRLGVMVWGEYASWGVRYEDLNALGTFIAEWTETVEQHFNHPSIVTWCPLNEAWNNLGNVYYHQKKNDAAVDAYKKARTLRPNDTTVIYQTALACFDAGRIADAERAFLDLIEADPQNAEAYNDLGNLYFQAGEIDKAKDCYRKVLEINPRHPNRSRIEQRIYQ